MRSDNCIKYKCIVVELYYYIVFKTQKRANIINRIVAG